MKALISVSDKTGIADFAKELHALGFELLSTGGTARLLTEAGLPVREVADVTHFPEMLGGRVKTLHPAIHGALLARRDVPAHMAALKEQGIEPIDLVVINLYPFEATVAREHCTLPEAIENIDIGGPAMVRSAAKNWRDVAVLTDASQYPAVLEELKQGAGCLSEATRFALAVAAFNRVAQYDAAISNWLSAIDFDASAPGAAPVRTPFPAQSNACFVRAGTLRYGENPHQQAAYYRELAPAPGTLATAQQLQGKELSYNNIADADAAWECVRQWQASAGQGEEAAACVIVKHANPCGVALGASAMQAYDKAFRCDPASAFGGIIAFNTPLDGATAAEIIARQFVEVLMAPAFAPDALQALAAKPNVRVLRIALGGVQPGGATPWARGHNALEFKRIGGGLLLQTGDHHTLREEDLQVVTQRQPTPEQVRDALFAWRVAQFVKSNAIVFCKGGMTMGVGAGQMSRLDSARIAAIKAQAAKLSLAGTVAASDAFFPFRDGLDVVIDQGAECVIQPGGSIRDQEVIDAANERGIAMLFSGVRHFRH